ncbi:hypothetical protein Acr_07g0013620 [Actinidia rufa]|uniref:Uncharacterized protein n=1 Tax=Actinidia rufa TaxID=165716 RepID=A0A7J0EYA2_9ERIC|nr:hypothetical protein Acr_07g0013620 [Actinidia rufa]
MDVVSTLGEVRTTNEVRTLEDVDIVLGNPSLMSRPYHMARDIFGKGVKQRAWAKSLHHGHNHDLITRRWEAFFCLTRQLMKLAVKSLLKSPNESMVPESNFRNHDLANPFRVVEKALHITSVSPPFIDSELGRQFESGGDLGSHHPFSEWRLSLLNHGIQGYRSARSGVDGVNTGIQVPDLLSEFRWMIGILSKRKSSLLFGDGDGDLEFAVDEPDLCYGDFVTPRHPIGWSGEVIGLLE